MLLRCGPAIHLLSPIWAMRSRAAGAMPKRSRAIAQVLAADGSDAPAHFNLGRSLAALDRLEEAVASFRAALTHAPADTDPDRLADVHANLGEALVGLGRFDEAFAACRAIAALPAADGGME